MTFSDRMGLVPVQIVQMGEMTDDLVNSIWNCIHQEFNLGEANNSLYTQYLNSFFKILWIEFFKQPVDLLRVRHSENVINLKEMFLKSSWNRKYDLVEFLVGECAADRRKNYINAINSILETENSGYRIITRIICPISTKDEAVEVSKALNKKREFPGATTHLETALLLMSDRETPDHRNSIKESISAVESVCIAITGKTNSTLGQLLDHIEKDGKIHPALKKAFSNLYGWTSNEGGIRHAMLDEPNLTMTDARFMLVACSAFVNYIIDKTK